MLPRGVYCSGFHSISAYFSGHSRFRRPVPNWLLARFPRLPDQVKSICLISIPGVASCRSEDCMAGPAASR